MKKYTEMSKEELKEELAGLEEEYKKFQSMNLKLDMSRGKPSKEQLDIELQKSIDSLKSGKGLTADEVDAQLYKEFEI